MPVAFVWLWSFLLSIVVPIVGKIVFTLGFGLLVYDGIDYLFANILLSVQQNLSSVPALPLLGIMGVDKCLNVITSAYMVKITLSGIARAHANWTPKA